MTQKLLRALPARMVRRWAARRQSAVQVRKAFKLHSSPTATATPQIKTTGARALINKLMRATKFGMRRLSCGDIKKKKRKKPLRAAEHNNGFTSLFPATLLMQQNGYPVGGNTLCYCI